MDRPFILEGDAPLSCLLLHGFAGTAGQMLPFAEHLQREGITCSAPLLAGHGTTQEDLLPVTPEEWLKGAEEAYEGLASRKKEITVIGHSMGGAIGIHLAARYPVKALVLLATPLAAWPGARPVISILARICPVLSSPHFALMGSEEKRKVAGYFQVPAASVLAFLRLLDLVRPELPRVSAPTLIFQAWQDYVVPFTNAQAIKKRLGFPCAEIRYLTKTLHLPHLDREREEVFAESLRFLRKHGGL
ncbi:MAG: alpha/beta fold hydrolase [Armatimonadetes bacterium]|nr:alpha/beta fold hydrolase [Armatimonadota bacterium]